MKKILPSCEVLRLMWGPLWLDGQTLTCVRKRTVAGICSSSVCTGQYVKFLKWVFPLKTYGQFKVDTVIIPFYRCFILLKVFQLIKAYEEDLNLGSIYTRLEGVCPSNRYIILHLPNRYIVLPDICF